MLLLYNMHFYTFNIHQFNYCCMKQSLFSLKLEWIYFPKNSKGSTSRFGYSIQALPSDKTMISNRKIILILISV